MRLLMIGSEGYVGSSLRRVWHNSHEVIPWNHQQELFSLGSEWFDENPVDAVINCTTVMDRGSLLFQGGGPSDWVNVEGVRHLTEILQGRSIRLIHLSTAEVHGRVYHRENCDESELMWLPREEMSESLPFKPRNVYEKSKLMGEFLAEAYPYSTVLRFSHLMGESVHPRSSWVLRVIRAAQQLGQIGVQSPQEKIELEVQGSGKEFVDALHVTDLAHCIERVVLGPPELSSGLKFLIGGGRENLISMRALVAWIEAESGVQLLVRGMDRESDVGLGYCASNQFAENRLGWKPEFRVRDWLRREFAFLDEEVSSPSPS